MSKGFLKLLAILALLIPLTIAVPIVRGDEPEDFTIPEKQDLQYPNLGYSLNKLIAAVEAGSFLPEQAATDSPLHSGSSVGVTVWLSSNVEDVASFVEDNGGDPRKVGEDYIKAYVPVTLLGQLSEQAGVVRVREIVPPPTTYGNFTSQGIQTHHVPAWHTAGYNGQDVKVGIIDQGFERFRELMGQELPVTVKARCYTDIEVFTNNLADCEVGGVHGTASAENVTDMAPGVSLYIANDTYLGDPRETIDWMISEGVSVINRSLGSPFEGPGDGTSPISYSWLKTVDRAVEGGIVFVNSAGNEHQQSWFRDTPPSIYDPDGDGAGLIEFADGDITNSMGYHVDGAPGLQLPEGHRVWVDLRWEDTWPRASTDLNIGVFDASSGQLIDASLDSQSGGSYDYPRESLLIEIPKDGEYFISVAYLSGELPDWIQLIASKSGELEHYTEGHSIIGVTESANPGMLAVGATHYWDTDTIASYSSRGPALDGRIKPDIVGTACGEVASYEPLTSPDGTIACWFGGTSSAGPHVAGLAALVRQRFPDFTSDQVADYLKHYAEQREAPDPNNTWGHGFAVLSPPDTEPPPGFDTSCRETLTVDGDVPGQWAPGCKSEARSGSHARYYTFTLAQQSEVTITLESDIDTYLYLRDGDARSGDVGDDRKNDDIETGVNNNSRLQLPLPAGSYTIEATTYDTGQTGSFTLTVSGLGGTVVQPPPADQCVQALTADGAVSGTWAAGCDSQERSGSHARYYSFTLEQQSEVTITLARDSDDGPDPYLYLLQGHGRTGTILNDHEADDDAAGGRNARAVETLAAGNYTIEATTYNAGETGSFTLTVSGLGGTVVQPPPTDQCGQTLTADGAVSGTWAAGCDSQERSGSHARYYSFTLEQQSEVTITLARDSDDGPDPYLYLRQGHGRTGTILNDHEADDDAAGGRNSLAVETLAAGNYTIEATTYNAGETGSFTLTVSGLGGTVVQPPPADQCSQALTADGAVSGTWAAGCDSQERSGSHARYYSFTLEQQSEVTITLARDSDDGPDPYLYLRQGHGRTGTILNDHEADDDAAGGRNSLAVETLAAGNYTIEATTYAAGETGSFTLTISGLGGTVVQPPPADQCGQTLTADGTISGTWTAGCDSETPAPGSSSGDRLAHFYTFTLTQGAEVTIDLESENADTYMYLREGDARSGTTVEDGEDDDGGEDTNSRIQKTLVAGTYTIEATTYNAGQTGSFTLTISGLGNTTSGP